MVAARIRTCVRDGDGIARLGGDEFALLLEDSGSARISAVAARLIDEIGKPYALDEGLVHVGVSIGIATASDGQTPAETLLKHADLALYAAKSAGRGTYRFFGERVAS